MFGLGDYSFAPYKAAVSGMYPHGIFALLDPKGGRPVLLDDTCYQIGFNIKEEAEVVVKALNGRPMQQLVQAIAPPGAKRTITKALLMRLDVKRLTKYCTAEELGLTEKEFALLSKLTADGVPEN